VDDHSSAAVNPFWQRALWSALVAFALLDVIHPRPALTGSWWGVFFVLWVVPWHEAASGPHRSVRIVAGLSAVFLFAWLIWRTETAFQDSVQTWYVLKSFGRWELLSFPIQITLVSIATAALTVIPLRRIARERAMALGILASLPFAVNLAVQWIRWTKPPVANAIHIYNAVMPVLVIAEACSLLARFPLNVDRILSYRRARNLAIGLLNGKLNAFVAVFVLYGGALAGCAVAAKLIGARFQAADFRVGTLLGSLAVFSAATFALLFAIGATWRSLQRAGRRHTLIADFATLCRIFIAGTLGVMLVVFSLVLPRIGYLLSEALQRLPGPDWSVSRAAPGVLRLSGGLQTGVSDAVASALAQDPLIHRLELDSHGGDVGQSLALAALVEKYSLSTLVRRECFSACVLAFAAGKERVLMTGAKLGYHRAQSHVWDDINDNDGLFNQEYTAFLISKGVSEEFARKAYSVPYDDLWYPSVNELLAAGVITGKPLP